ncbi:hypothetical protein MATR_27570 [Marivirga tractuosa]|uniref:Uncharacterized protein n=1 Tax=Marivirga tractuosa (strain ATCC 23168 / DSM 4126 / NBRC 15989 / NCIMB 1408 / VKM B-1430 / H-43) TaxID=643867 RepID=E4TLW4_MARTH|nr:hypothetical protein [Marivirga tractuosa]ADR23393.1 hypothetical protein Ftrac_3419 [Marivirga tractuosa DSM 4126]BDD15932.1 hypothetical protein MATR_27570 [Marivirga tractuosa]
MNEKYFEYIEEQRMNESERNEFLMRRAEYEYLKNRKFALYGITLSVIGLVFILTREVAYEYFDRQFSFIFIIIGAVSLAFGVGFILYRYLQNGSFSKYSNSDISNQNLRSEIQDLKFELLKLRKKSGETTDSENISKTINKAIDSTLTEGFIRTKIDSFYSEKAIAEAKRKDIIDEFEDLGYRIGGELIRLRKSANINLVIGTVVTICAIVALGYEVFYNELDFENTTKVISHYIPRLSIIVFVEIFAFFFLKLYKATLSDIKYFNNEKTNIDFKIISLKAALNTSNDQIIQLMLQELIKTERNFKLGKGESTVELEKSKNEVANNEILTSIFEKLNKK